MAQEDSLGRSLNWAWKSLGIVGVMACADGAGKDDTDTDGATDDDTDGEDTDGEDTDVIRDTDENTAPTVSATPELATFAGSDVTLSAAGVDPDGDALTYAWTRVSGPSTPGRSPGDEVEAETGDVVTFHALYGGTYTFSVVASDGTANSAPAEIEVRVHDLRGGGDHAVALKPDGTLWAWGNAEDGRLGIGGDSSSSTPTRVCDTDAVGDCASDPLTGVVQVAVGASHTLVLRSDGTVWAWGANYDGRAGRDPAAGLTLSLPQAVCADDSAECDTLSGVVAVAAGNSHSVALMTDGTVRTWGLNNLRQLGDGGRADESYVPVEVCDVDEVSPDPCTSANGNVLEGVRRIVSGGDHTLAITDDGLVAWGDNQDGQCATGSTSDEPAVPTGVCAPGSADSCTGPLTGVVAVDAGARLSIVLRDDGTVWSWGDDSYGELSTVTASAAGCDSSSCAAAPVQACASLDSPCTDPIDDATLVVAGRSHAAALRDGEVWTWGRDIHGALGHGTVNGATTVARVCGVGTGAGCATPLSDVIGVRSGLWRSWALLGDETLVGWGYNASGALGDGTTDARSTPVEITGY